MTSLSETTSQRPYLLRAMHEWMTDNGATPHVVIDVGVDGVDVPAEYVKDGKLVLNVSYAAVRDLDIGNEFLSFEARFAGRARQLHLPIDAVLGIYARESGRGMIFSPEEDLQDQPEAGEETTDIDKTPKQAANRRPELKIVK